MKMLNLTLEQTMQILAVLICNVNFLLNEFIPTLKNTCFGPKKMMKTFLPAVLENTEEKHLHVLSQFFTIMGLLLLFSLTFAF